MLPLISDPVIQSVPVVDNHEPLISARSLARLRISGKRAAVNPGFHFVREGVARRLLAAQWRLPAGVHLVLEEGHRTVALQQQYFDEHLAVVRQLMPHLPEAELRREATRYVADPQGIPPHSTGGAVDVLLVDAQGRALEMGSDSDESAQASENRSYTQAENIGDEAKANRALLIDAMSGAGFVNYFTEWWHWSYGDQYWAHLTGQAAVYGSV